MNRARQNYRTHRDRKRNEARRDLRKFIDGRGKGRAAASRKRSKEIRGIARFMAAVGAAPYPDATTIKYDVSALG